MTRLSDPMELRRGASLPNRLVLAPMTNQQSNVDGTLSPDDFRWLTARAEGGFGLLQTAAAYVHPAGQSWPGQLGIASGRHVPRLERLATAVAEHGARSSVQLHHGGVRADPRLTRQPLLTPWDDDSTGARAMSTDEVHQAVEDFADAAVRAELAGFNGVEVHGGHGFLVGQFLDASNNHRVDGYGSDPDGRSRFVKEVVHTIRQRTGPDFHVGLRLSVERHGQILTDMVDLVRDLFADGDIDVLDLSLWDVRKLPENAPEGAKPLIDHFLDLPRHGVALGAAGHIGTAEEAQRLIDQGVDLAYIGKAAVADRDFARNAIHDTEYRPQEFPLTPDQLRDERLGDSFIDYFATNWPDLVQH